MTRNTRTEEIKYPVPACVSMPTITESGIKYISTLRFADIPPIFEGEIEVTCPSSSFFKS